ncbi:MAG: hypothetical protein VX777_03140 [Chlamydiota bacterium]|nr:hypothetical protein [Chlamydiota bacterium]
MTLSTRQIRKCVMLLLTKAVLDLFPKAKLFRGGVTDYGYYYDIDFGSQNIDQHALKQIEERMSLLIFEAVEFKNVEMLRENAMSLLVHNGQRFRADMIAQDYSPGVIPFLQLGGCLEPCFDEIDVSPSELKNFKLTSVEKINFKKSYLVRVWGTAFSEGKYLKKFLKSSSRLGLNSHRPLAEELELCVFGEEQHYWLPRGDQVLRQLDLGGESVRLNAFSEEEVVDGFVEIYNMMRIKPNQLAGEVRLCRDLEEWQQVGLWRSNYYYADRTFLFVDKQQITESVISSLQFIAEKCNMSGSECCWIVSDLRDVPPKQHKIRSEYCKILVEALDSCGYKYTFEESSSAESIGPRAYLTYTDAVGKRWKGPFVGLELSKLKNIAIISRSVYGSYERYIAYLLENDKERLNRFL